MAEIEEEAVGFPVMCHLVTGQFTQGSSTFFLNYLHCSDVYRLYNLADMLRFRTVTLPRTEQIRKVIFRYVQVYLSQGSIHLV